MTRGALRRELDRRGLDTAGPRSTLIARLSEAITEEKFDYQEILPKAEADARSEISELSVSSAHSNLSSLASCRALEAAKLAGLRARAVALKKKHELDKQAVELQAKRENLSLEIEMEEAIAREASLTPIEPSPRTGTAQQPIRLDDTNSDTNSDRHQTNEPSYDHITRLHLPTLEFSTFRGNNEYYPSFMRAFETNIASKLRSEEEKLHYLLQYTADKPREIVATCLYLPSEHGYQEAKRLLDRRFGNRAQMALGLVEKMLESPNIKSEDVESLDSFAILLRGSLNALRSLPHDAGSVDVKTIRALVQKLPYYMKDKWSRIVDGIEQTKYRQATFEDFVDFVEVEARVATNPSYGRLLMKSGPMKENLQAAGPSRGKLFTGNVQDFTRTPTRCLCCDQKHETHECTVLQTKTSEEKHNFILENRLCFSCLSANHISRFCKDKKKCNICGGWHATVLHRDQPKSKSPAVTSGHVAPVYRGGAKLQAVAVRVTVCDKSVITYAFLDSGSTHSFICAQLADELAVSPTEKTSITLSTINKEQRIESCVIPHVWIQSLDGDCDMELPPLFVLDTIPVSRKDIPNKSDLQNWSYLEDSGVTLDEQVEREVGLLIGSNAAAAMEPIQVVPGREGGPHAILTRFGWVLSGIPKIGIGFKLNYVELMSEQDSFGNRAETQKGYSVEDHEWLSKVQSSCALKDGQYEIALPFRNENPTLPNNRVVAERRLGFLRSRMERQPEMAAEYRKQIQELVDKGYAEKAPEPAVDAGHEWYLPHHGVRHPAKPEKLRIVFDCASKFKGISLNDELLQGPDLTNALTDVLIRFRQEVIAFKADIESMFLRVQVPQQQRDFIRFLWWENGNPEGPIEEYRVTSHLFGAVSSPSCANYALQQTARDFGHCQEPKVASTINRNFYVDDALISSASEEDAIKLALGLKELCSKGCFKLTKFSSNSIAVLQAIPKEDQAASVRDLQLGSDCLPADRALGVHWDVQTDTLGCQVDVDKFRKRPVTRRGILSATASFYDPFGIASPCVIRARMLQQELTRLRLGWDEKVPMKYSKAWNKWLQELSILAQYRVPRIVCVGGLSAAALRELHHFSDASERGYGVVTYIRTISNEGQISCGLLLSKAHLAPIKTLSIPRLELTAATLAVKVNLETQRALDFPIQRTYFWTDSTTVLKYIRNKKSRFHVFVSNRLAAIHDASSINQWFWVPSQENPADLVSRGMDAAKFVDSALWKCGPNFLWRQSEHWPQLPKMSECKEEDPEVKVVLTITASATTASSSEASDPTSRLIRHYSSWSRLLKAVAWIQRVLARLKNERRSVSSDLQLSDIERAEKHIIRHVQAIYFQADINALLH